MALSTPAPRCISWEQAWSVRDMGSNLGAGSCSNHIKAPHYHRANLTCRDTAFMFTCTCRFIYKYIFLHIYIDIYSHANTLLERNLVSPTQKAVSPQIPFWDLICSYLYHKHAELQFFLALFCWDAVASGKCSAATQWRFLGLSISQDPFLLLYNQV